MKRCDEEGKSAGPRPAGSPRVPPPGAGHGEPLAVTSQHSFTRHSSFPVGRGVSKVEGLEFLRWLIAGDCFWYANKTSHWLYSFYPSCVLLVRALSLFSLPFIYFFIFKSWHLCLSVPTDKHRMCSSGVSVGVEPAFRTCNCGLAPPLRWTLLSSVLPHARCSDILLLFIVIS